MAGGSNQDQPFLQQVRNTANVTLDQLLLGYSANITAAYNQANAAYAQANTALSAGDNALIIAEEAYGQANLAYNQANTAITDTTAAYNQANAAFTQANAAYANSNTAFNGSGVTPGTYGGASSIPVLVVDYRGRVTNAYTVNPQVFGSSQSGIVPASGGGTSNYLRADGNWATPAPIVTNGANGTMNHGDLVLSVGQGLYLQDSDMSIYLQGGHSYQITILADFGGGGNRAWNIGFGLYFNGTQYGSQCQVLGNYYSGEPSIVPNFILNPFYTNENYQGTLGPTGVLLLQTSIATITGGEFYLGWGISGPSDDYAVREGGSTITAILCS